MSPGAPAKGGLHEGHCTGRARGSDGRRVTMTQAQRLRVLHVLVPAPVGGLERVVQMLAVAQHRDGRDVEVAAVIAAGRGEHPFFEPLERESVPCHRLEVGARAYRLERGLVRDTIRDRGADVVHTHGYRADVVGGSAARGLGRAVVSTAHGFTGGGWKNRLYERMQVRAYRRGGHVVAVSRPLGRLLLDRGVPEHRLHVIRNAWLDDAAPLGRAEARSRLGLSEELFVAGWVGRVGREKGPDLAVRAIAAVPDAHLSIIGEGPDRLAVEALAGGLGLEGRIRWHGAVANAGELLAAFDVFVSSSRTEGTPIVILEALAAGTPIVATSVGGVPDIIRDGIEALLVPGEDTTALARAIRDVRESAEASTVRAAAGRERLRDAFGVDAWRDAYRRVYTMAARGDEGGSGRSRRRGTTGMEGAS